MLSAWIRVSVRTRESMSVSVCTCPYELSVHMYCLYIRTRMSFWRRAAPADLNCLQGAPLTLSIRARTQKAAALTAPPVAVRLLSNRLSKRVPVTATRSGHGHQIRVPP